MQSILIKRPFHYPDFIIKTNNPRFASELKKIFRSYISEDDAGNEVMEIGVDFDGQTAKITLDNKTWQSDDALQEISNILYENIHIINGIFAMHAAAVSIGDKSAVMTAPTGTGKTTLTTYLIHKGFDYLTDDCVFIDLADFSVIPCGNDIHLREGGVEVLKQHHIQPKSIERFEDETIQRFLFAPQNTIKEKKELGVILFLERCQENRVQEISTSERLMELMKSPLTPYSIHREYLEFLRRLAQKPCMKLFYRDMDFVADYLMGILL